jgi:hypothetical protein
MRAKTLPDAHDVFVSALRNVPPPPLPPSPATERAAADSRSTRIRGYSEETLEAMGRRIGLAPGTGKAMCQKFGFASVNSIAT